MNVRISIGLGFLGGPASALQRRPALMLRTLELTSSHITCASASGTGFALYYFEFSLCFHVVILF